MRCHHGRHHPARARLESEASLLDTDVQELLNTKELARDEPASGPQLQWATHTEFSDYREVARAQLLCDSPDGCWRRERFCSTWAVVGLGLGMQGGVVVVPLADGPSGVAHPSDSYKVVFIEIASDLEGQLDIISEVPEGSIRFSPDGRLPHIPSLVRLAAWDDRCIVVDEGCVLPTPGSAKEEHASLLFAKKLILTISGVSGMI